MFGRRRETRRRGSDIRRRRHATGDGLNRRTRRNHRAASHDRLARRCRCPPLGRSSGPVVTAALRAAATGRAAPVSVVATGRATPTTLFETGEVASAATDVTGLAAAATGAVAPATTVVSGFVVPRRRPW